MENTISQKELYSRLSKVGKEVMAGKTYIVLWHSKPAYKLMPIYADNPVKKKYSKADLPQFIFRSKHPENKNLSGNYKKWLY